MLSYLPEKQTLFHTPELGQLFAALARAQCNMALAEKDGTNPYFKSKYPTLASVRLAIGDHLGREEIGFVQLPQDGPDGRPRILTVLGHSSGEFFGGIFSAMDDIQAQGSLMTYMRRYGLCAIAGIAPQEDDDDGNMAQERFRPARAAGPPVKDQKSLEFERKKEDAWVAYVQAYKERNPDTPLTEGQIRDHLKTEVRESGGKMTLGRLREAATNPPSEATVPLTMPDDPDIPF